MGAIEDRGNGSYRIKVYLGELNGKQITKSKTVHIPSGMKSERRINAFLEEELVKFKDELEQGAGTAKKIKFSTAMEGWFQQMELENRNHPTTITRYKNCSERIMNAFGYLNLKDIKKQQIQKFINDIAVNGKSERAMKTQKTENAGLSTKSQGLYLTVISNVFRYAIDNGYCDKNPCDGVHTIKKPVKEREAYTIEEAQNFLIALNEFAHIEFKTFYYLILFTGCRYGEIMGLHWSDIDFVKSRFRINRTAVTQPGKGLVDSAPKTKKSARSIPLNDYCYNALLEYREYWNDNASALGDEFPDTDALFINFDKGCRYWGENTARVWLKKFLDEHNLPYKAVHSFRHYVASVLILNGVDAVSVASILGHSTPYTTLTTYAHAFEDSVDDKLDIVAQATTMKEIG